VIDGEPKLSVRAGLTAALCWGGLGALAAAVAVAIWGWGERWDTLAELGDYDAWAGSFARTALWPAIDCACVFACSGWAAHAPRPPRRIASSALIIAGASLVLWTLIAALELTPRRIKAVEHPAIYPSELVALATPPLATAVALTVAWRRRKGP
jgi:hypothetical protein